MGLCSNYENTIINSNLHLSTWKFNVIDLQEYSNYSITITAFNDRGMNSSQVLNITTKSSGIQKLRFCSLTTLLMHNIVPDGPPNDFTVVSTNLTAINITWAPVACIKWNSIIKGYTVHYRKNSEARMFNESRNTIIDTNATIVNLDPNTEYVLEVRAVNDENMPGPPANLTVNTSIPEGKDI